MKFAAAAASLLAATTMAAPTARDTPISDADLLVLQFALTLENLENYFYTKYLAQFQQWDFAGDDFPDWVRNRVEQIASHEAVHVAELASVITAAGGAPVEACNYTFPGINSARDFMNFAAVVENVGTSAYLGAAQLIDNKGYLTAAGSILTTEARHRAWLGSAVLKTEPWSGPNDTPLNPALVYTIASQYIVSCPSTNYALPFTPLPPFSLGSDGTITPPPADGTILRYLSGIQVADYTITNGTVGTNGIPTGVQGIYYAAIFNHGLPIAGVQIFNNPFPSYVPNPLPPTPPFDINLYASADLPA